jgi:hypothetical protein
VAGSTGNSGLRDDTAMYRYKDQRGVADVVGYTYS